MNSKILFKLPSRNRPTRVFEVLDETIKNLNNLNNFTFLLSLDEDDITMNNLDVINKLNSYPNMNIFFGVSDSKISAVNRDMDKINTDWDILVLLSDDMIPIYKGFDDIIREKFHQFFPNFDGVTWFNDGHQKNKLNTLCILGKKYYERFGYIYNPEYKSLFCDNEFTIVAEKLGKQKYFDIVIIEHRQYSIGNNKDRYDELYIKNDNFLNYDSQIYKKRQSINFEL
jgi:hypothetical protein